MLRVLEYLINLFLIFIIFLRIPEQDIGLERFTTKNNLLGSPNSARRFLNILTGIAILIDFLLVIKLNSLSH